MTLVPTQVGQAYVLSARAKRALKIHSTWITRPEIAARQVLQRRLGAVLRRCHWQLQACGALPYPRYARPDGRIAYVVVRVRGPRSRGVRRILEKYRTRLLREGAVLMVFSRQWKRLRRLAEHSHGLLEVAPLDLRLTAATGASQPS